MAFVRGAEDYQRRQHFRHRRGAECSDAYETSLHNAAEQVIKENSEILLPAVVARHGLESRNITERPGKFPYDDARLRVQMDGINPDVVLREAPHRRKVSECRA